MPREDDKDERMGNMNIVYVWLLAGVIFVAAEALGISGIGLLFAGLGAVSTGAAIHLGFAAEDNNVVQFLIFFIATALWALILWKPLKHFRQRQRGHYSNIVGETAYAGSQGLSKKSGGEVTWSGTIMKAQLIPDSPLDHLEAASQVVIVAVKGATLIVKPKD